MYHYDLGALSALHILIYLILIITSCRDAILVLILSTRKPRQRATTQQGGGEPTSIE